MAGLNFPSNPITGDTHTIGTTTWTWNGYAWIKFDNPNKTIGILTVTNQLLITTSTQSVSTVTGALVVKGGVGIGGNLWVGGDFYAGGRLVLTTASITGQFEQGADIQIITFPGTGIVRVSNTSTLQSVTGRGSTTTNVVTFANTTNSVSTTTGGVIVSGGLSVVKNITIGANIVASGAAGGVGQYLSSDGSKVVWSTSTFNGGTIVLPLIINNNTAATSTSTGALQVKGGAGIGGDVWVEGRVTSESLKIADSVFDSTVVSVNTTATSVIDTYSITQFRSAKYMIQIDEGTGPGAHFQVIEILLLVDNVGTVYATEYGLLTSNGYMGDFAADVQGDNMVRLYFTPYSATSKVVKVLRTGMAV